MSRIKTVIIGLLAALSLGLLSGCSAIRLGYSNGSQLAWWWLDGYFDFTSEHTPQVKRSLDQWFEWHRNTQLEPLAALLASAQAQITEPTTAAQACRWQERFREVLEPTVARAINDFADVVPGLTEAQIKYLERRYAKSNDEMRRDFLQPDPVERQAEAVKRTVERTERIYGALNDAQLKQLSAGIAASPFSPEMWLAERQRRQRDALQTLRKLVADKPDREARVQALRGLVQRVERSPQAEYRAYQLKLIDYNCAFAAQMHNAMTPAQRQKARDNFKGWEADLRALMAAPQPAPATGPNGNGGPGG